MIPLSIIIPASNEAGYIGACLDAVLEQDHEGDVQVVVVANGCTDDTPALACAKADAFSARGWALRVETLGPIGKVGALNHGDGCAIHAARLYLDADVRMGPRLLSGLAAALDASGAVYAGGRLVVAPAASRFSRAYGRFWSRLPFMSEGVTGAGLFAVNADGRARWGLFPPVISDDSFARLQFTPAERVLVDEPYSWPLSEGFARLVRVRRRQDEGVREIARLFPDLPPRAGHVRVGLWRLARLAIADPSGFAAYVGVMAAVRARRGRSSGWVRGR